MGGGGLAGSMQMDRGFMVMKNIVLRGLSVPVPGLYTCILPLCTCILP